MKFGAAVITILLLGESDAQNVTAFAKKDEGVMMFIHDKKLSKSAQMSKGKSAGKRIYGDSGYTGYMKNHSPTAAPTKFHTESDPEGVNDLETYQKVAKAFIGINPVKGDGSGFVIRNMKDDGFGEIPDSNTGRNNLCTCDCNAGYDGVGCIGYGGINFRYSSMLWIDPFLGNWDGQMQALQQVPTTTTNINYMGQTTDLHFLGGDVRLYPGGPAVYNVACTQQDCGDLFAGVFRQYNGPVSCKAAMEEDEATSATSCKSRCKNSQTYQDWLAYCGAMEEDATLGYSGYGK